MDTPTEPMYIEQEDSVHNLSKPKTNIKLLHLHHSTEKIIDF